MKNKVLFFFIQAMVELVDAEGPPEDVGFATVSPLADISSQVILGSRIITRDLSKMKDTGAIVCLSQLFLFIYVNIYSFY